MRLTIGMNDQILKLLCNKESNHYIIKPYLISIRDHRHKLYLYSSIFLLLGIFIGILLTSIGLFIQ